MGSPQPVSERLRRAGFELPDAPMVVGTYVPAVRAGNLVFTSGQLPFVAGELMACGLVDRDVAEETAIGCARQAALNALAAAGTVCDLDVIGRVVKLVGYVASSEEFVGQPRVINGASDVLVAAFGEHGTHAREAVGVRRLPLDAPVEVSLVLEIAR